MRQIIVLLLCGIGWVSAPLEAYARERAATRERFNWGPFSLRLSDGMAEPEAINAIGYQPNKAERTTCGTESSNGEWQCRILTYGNDDSNLVVFERSSDEGWVVNSWSVYP
jgi:hypothetical protein